LNDLSVYIPPGGFQPSDNTPRNVVSMAGFFVHFQHLTAGSHAQADGLYDRLKKI